MTLEKDSIKAAKAEAAATLEEEAVKAETERLLKGTLSKQKLRDMEQPKPRQRRLLKKKLSKQKLSNS